MPYIKKEQTLSKDPWQDRTWYPNNLKANHPTLAKRTTFVTKKTTTRTICWVLWPVSALLQAKTLTKLRFYVLVVLLYFHPVDAAWTPWGAWASCSVTCGEGTRSRSRECQFAHPECKGKTCSDEKTGTRDVGKCFQTGAHIRNKK